GLDAARRPDRLRELFQRVAYSDRVHHRRVKPTQRFWQARQFTGRVAADGIKTWRGTDTLTSFHHLRDQSFARLTISLDGQDIAGHRSVLVDFSPDLLPAGPRYLALG